jgi:flagellar biosynthesis protein FlhB
VSAKTEEPTPKRLRKAKEDGDSGASAFAAQAVAFVVAVTLLPPLVRTLAGRSTEALHAAIAHAGDAEPPSSVSAGSVARDLLRLTLPLLVGVAIAGGAAGAVQTGGLFSTRKLAPRLERLDPIAGLKNLVSPARLFAVARALLGAAVVGYLTYRGLRTHAADLARLGGRLEYVGLLAAEIARSLAWNAALVGLAIAAVDVVVVRAGWRRGLRMTKDEVKREYRESEGDPEVKHARERAHHEMLAAATIGSVKGASVVVVNPTHIACALRYDDKAGDEAPVVLACGEGELAARILRAAEDYGVPIVRDVPLARALVELEVGDTIPEALYEAVAEILREVWGDEIGENDAAP